MKNNRLFIQYTYLNMSAMLEQQIIIAKARHIRALINAAVSAGVEVTIHVPSFVN